MNRNGDNPTNSHPDPLARAVHVSLLIGSLASAVLFIGGLVVVLTHGQVRPDTPPRVDARLFQSALHGNGFALLDLGVLVLMLTPLLRIVVLATGWGLRRDYRFTLVALVVLALLTVSLLIGVG